VYTAFSGSHQDAIRKCLQKQQPDEHWQVAYLPIDPHDLGRDYQAVVRVNSQSGKGGIAFVLERDYGLSLPRWMQVQLAQIVQRESEKQGGEMSGEAIYQLFLDHFVAARDGRQLNGYQLERNGGSDVIEARISSANVEQILRGEGEGAMSAFVDAWQRDSGQDIAVVDYSEHAIGAGTNAEAVSYVQLNIDGHRIGGAAMDHDTVSASLMAVIAALSRVNVEKTSAA
jgi:2-isopropylmalate synthase